MTVLIIAYSKLDMYDDYDLCFTNVQIFISLRNHFLIHKHVMFQDDSRAY